MRCPVCGRENNNGNKFCDSCGARLVGGNSPKPSKNRAVLLAIVSVLVIILLGECAYLLVLKLKQKLSFMLANMAMELKKSNQIKTIKKG